MFGRFLELGIATPDIAASVQFYERLSKTLGEDVARNPAKWDAIAKVTGVPTQDFFKAWMKHANRALWDTDNVVKLQRYLELKEKGLSPAKAIHETEKDIPNYRIPPRILGSRSVSLAARTPFFEFSRYHYGRFKAFAHLAADMVGPKATMQERTDAVGRMFALFVAAEVVYNGIDKGLQQVTGNKNAKMIAPGPLTLTEGVHDIYYGTRPITDVIAKGLTLSPTASLAYSAITGKDWSGRDIVPPGSSPRKALEKVGDYAANMFAPVHTIQRTIEGGLPQLAADTFGLKLPTEQEAAGLAKRPKALAQARKSQNKFDARRPGPVEQIESGASNFLKFLEGQK